MRRYEKINQTSAAAINRAMVIDLLRVHGLLSRRQLTEKTGLRSSSITYITRDLIDLGLVREHGKRERSSVGKKQVFLEIAADYGWVIGAGIDGDWISMVMLDAQGKVIDRDHLAVLDSFDILTQRLKQRIDTWIGRRGQDPSRLLGLGVGTPGVIDSGRGVVLRSVRFEVTDWPMAERFHEAFGVPVTIDNDSNFAALAEARQGHARGTGDFIYLLINASEHGDRYSLHGLGTSLFLRGRLYRGAHFAAGEIDKLIQGDSIETVTAAQLLALSAADGVLDEDLKRFLDRLSLILAATTNLLDTRAILLGGNVSITNPAALEFLEGALNDRIVQVPERHVAVHPSLLQDHGVSTGAALAALDGALSQSGQFSSSTIE